MCVLFLFVRMPRGDCGGSCRRPRRQPKKSSSLLFNGLPNLASSSGELGGIGSARSLKNAFARRWKMLPFLLDTSFIATLGLQCSRSSYLALADNLSCWQTKCTLQKTTRPQDKSCSPLTYSSSPTAPRLGIGSSGVGTRASSSVVVLFSTQQRGC